MTTSTIRIFRGFWRHAWPVMKPGHNRSAEQLSHIYESINWACDDIVWDVFLLITTLDTSFGGMTRASKLWSLIVAFGCGLEEYLICDRHITSAAQAIEGFISS